MALRAVKGALCVSISVDRREMLWSILSVIQSCLWRFPFLLSRSRRWDHRTSLHRWQPRLKVSRSRGAYRLLARCEILPCMLFLLVPDPLLPREMGCHSFPPEAEKRKACNLLFYCPPLLYSDQKRKICQPSIALFVFWGLWLPGISLYFFHIWFPININHGIVAFDLPQRHNKEFSASCPFHHKVCWLTSFTVKSIRSLNRGDQGQLWQGAIVKHLVLPIRNELVMAPILQSTVLRTWKQITFNSEKCIGAVVQIKIPNGKCGQGPSSHHQVHQHKYTWCYRRMTVHTMNIKKNDLFTKFYCM